MRLAGGGKIQTALIVLAAVAAGCGQSTAHDGAAAARSRAQVVPAARDLYQRLFRTSARSVDLLDWGYTRCGAGTAMVSYSISMRLFAFAPSQNTDFDAYNRRVVSIVRAAGWTLRRRPSTRSVTLPTVPSAYYRIGRRDRKVRLTGDLSLAGDVNPLVGVSGTIVVSGPCFDADGSAGSLESRRDNPPFSPPGPSPSASHS
jgi:hypothetical protein